MPWHTLTEDIERDGFTILPECVPTDLVDALRVEVDRALAEQRKSPAGRRTVQAFRRLARYAPLVGELARSAAVRRITEPLLGSRARLIQSILFDKAADANWGVFWHQDLTIPVAARHDLPGFLNWSVKSGVVHVQPPAELLESMLIVRLQLDDCGETDGALRVLPGSHRAGRIADEQIGRRVEQEQPLTCTVPAGGAVVMRPLLLHASGKMTADGRRRVVHLQFTAAELPVPLAWSE